MIREIRTSKIQDVSTARQTNRQTAVGRETLSGLKIHKDVNDLAPELQREIADKVT